jgi:hypothetical protein
MTPKKIWCSLEGGRFPGSEFTTDQEGNYIHRHNRPHYVTGIYVDQTGHPDHIETPSLEGIDLDEEMIAGFDEPQTSE